MLTTLFLDWKLDPKQRKPLYTGGLDKDPNVLAAIQARKGSTRFPNKIYAQLNGAPLLFHTINKVSLVSHISTTLVVTPEPLDLPEDTPIYIHHKEDDVLGRYYCAALRYKPDYIVRITSDCPVLDPFLIEYVVYQAVHNKADYCSNVLYPLSFPDGQDIEVMSFDLLEFLNNTVKSKRGREHVTIDFREKKIWHQSFKTISIRNAKDLSDIKMSIDTPDDLARLETMNV